MYIMKKDHKQRRSFRLGLRAKILGVSLPVTIIMVIVMIAIAYNVSEADIMASSQSLLSTSAKDQSSQIEAWLNRKLDEVKTVKYDLESSGAIKDQKQLQRKLDDYYGLVPLWAAFILLTRREMWCRHRRIRRNMMGQQSRSGTRKVLPG